MYHPNLKLCSIFLSVALASCQSVQAPKSVDIEPAVIKADIKEDAKKDDGLRVINIAIELVKDNQLDNAINILSRYLEANDDNRAKLNLALIYFKTEQYDLAKDLLQAIQQTDSNNSIVLAHLAIIARQEGNFKTSKTLYLQALEDSDKASIHLNYAILLDLYLNELNEALKHYTIYQDSGLAEQNAIPLDKWIADLNRRIKRNK